jgi:hypothetical protein
MINEARLRKKHLRDSLPIPKIIEKLRTEIYNKYGFKPIQITRFVPLYHDVTLLGLSYRNAMYLLHILSSKRILRYYYVDNFSNITWNLRIQLLPKKGNLKEYVEFASEMF